MSKESAEAAEEQLPAEQAPVSPVDDGDDKGTDDTDGHRYAVSDRQIKHDITPLARR